MNEKSSKKNEQFPIEFPNRSNISKNAPITDVVEHETFPLELGSSRSKSGVSSPSFDNVAEVVATEIEPDKAEQTIHGRQM